MENLDFADHKLSLNSKFNFFSFVNILLEYYSTKQKEWTEFLVLVINLLEIAL